MFYFVAKLERAKLFDCWGEYSREKKRMTTCEIRSPRMHVKSLPPPQKKRKQHGWIWNYKYITRVTRKKILASQLKFLQHERDARALSMWYLLTLDIFHLVSALKNFVFPCYAERDSFRVYKHLKNFSKNKLSILEILKKEFYTCMQSHKCISFRNL